MIDLGRVGIWSRQLDSQPIALPQRAAAELEELGYPTLWIPEAIEREVLTGDDITVPLAAWRQLAPALHSLS